MCDKWDTPHDPLHSGEEYSWWYELIGFWKSICGG